MDELMVRFIHNIHRTEYKTEFDQAKKVLEQQSLLHESDSQIKSGVQGSFNALG